MDPIIVKMNDSPFYWAPHESPPTPLCDQVLMQVLSQSWFNVWTFKKTRLLVHVPLTHHSLTANVSFSPALSAMEHICLHRLFTHAAPGFAGPRWHQWINQKWWVVLSWSSVIMTRPLTWAVLCSRQVKCWRHSCGRAGSRVGLGSEPAHEPPWLIEGNRGPHTPLWEPPQ